MREVKKWISVGSYGKRMDKLREDYHQNPLSYHWITADCLTCCNHHSSPSIVLQSNEEKQKRVCEQFYVV